MKTSKIEGIASVIAAIEAARLAQGLSERELSFKAGKSHSAYWHWLRSKRDMSFNSVVAYATAVNLQLQIQKTPAVSRRG
jgi:transcriptional regulator with XRE-family HTH domain